jgi:V8-like Glu-specific endopeptidase
MRASSRNKLFKNKLIVLDFLAIFLVILSACGAPAAEEPAAPAEPAVPEEPVDPGDQFPVQYGQDSRTELFQHSDSKLKEMAASVAIFVHSQQVTLSGSSVSLDGYSLNEMSEMGWLVEGANVPMCSGELFASQPAPGFCTGFLVKEDILVTAGHCLQKTPCSDTSIVFGYFMEPDNSLSILTPNNIFKCEEVIAQVIPTQENQYLDYAIIKLDRPTGRAGLDFATEDHLEALKNVAVLGHPSGLPMKIASEAFVMSNETSDPFFVTNLDTFGSNSGSPVINTATYQVEGILVRGVNDYALSGDGSCVQVNRCPESGGTNCAGENATKMAMLAEQIPESSADLNCYPTFLLVLVLIVLVRLKIS